VPARGDVEQRISCLPDDWAASSHRLRNHETARTHMVLRYGPRRGMTTSTAVEVTTTRVVSSTSATPPEPK
jgi:hypothetical protein